MPGEARFEVMIIQADHPQRDDFKIEDDRDHDDDAHHAQF